MIDGLMMGSKERMFQELERLTLEGVYQHNRNESFVQSTREHLILGRQRCKHPPPGREMPTSGVVGDHGIARKSDQTSVV
jgi:hypothetical protein